MNHVIYSIDFPNGKKYIGQTTNLEKRIFNHKKSSKKPRSNLLLYNAINKYGWENLKITKIVNCITEDVDELEKLYIEKFKTINKQFGYNLDSGGQSNKKHSPTTKRKIKKTILTKPQHLFTKRRKKIAAYSLSGQLIRVFESATEAAKFYKVSINTIARAARNNKTSCNLVWQYVATTSESNNME